jgi:glycine cleavage system H protein
MTNRPEPSPDEYAVSLGIGPVPAIYVHLSPGHAATQPQHVLIGGTMSDIPADLRYSTDHLWVRPGTSGLVRVGVTDFAQQSLGDVVDVSSPKPGDTVTAGQACGDIESVKSLSDLIAPVTGTVRARNEDLAEAPDLVNTDPYGRGWLFEIQSDPASLGQQLAALMDADAYHGLAGA